MNIMELFYLGHASFLVRGKEVSFVIDPYADGSVPNLSFPRVSANYAFKSHDHDDHNALDLVRIVDGPKYTNYETIVVPHDHHNGKRRGLNTIHIFKVDGYKIIHLGDIGCIPERKVLNELKDADIVMAPINGHFTISARELRDILKEIKPRLVIPMHYYMKEYNSGYPDGNQIEEFKRLVDHYYEVNNFKINIDEETLDKGVVIFKEYMR